MDENVATFARPEAAASWVELVEGGQRPQGRDRHVADKALGMLVGVMRTAQLTMGESMSLGRAFERAREAGIPEFEPDATALALASPDGNEEDQIAYARSITIYKQCTETGLIQGDELPRAVNEVFDQLPGNTPLMRSMVETARQIAQIDLEYVLARA